MDPNVLTISLSRWMSLPDLDLRHWEKLVEVEQLQKSVLAAESDVYARLEKLSVCKASSRVSVGTVAAYYKDYVRRKGLKQYFRWYLFEIAMTQIRYYTSMQTFTKQSVAAGPQLLQ